MVHIHSGLRFLFILVVTLNTYASGVPRQNGSCFSPIDWQPCPGVSGVECASYQVPLDYAHPEVGKATLAVARVKATRQPRLGTIFVIPGGPGGSGVNLIQSVAVPSVIFTNGQYDLVSWDPRGVNQTDPKITCGFTSEDELSQFFNGSIFADQNGGVEARGNFTDKDDLDRFFAAVDATDAKMIEFGQRCMEKDPMIKYMGTAAAARDIVALADCLEGPETPINCYGISYGTVIGNYFVNMFPQRVGRVILDGVVDSIIWATEPSLKFFGSSLATSDAVLSGFAEECVEAGPQNCTFAQGNSTAASILQDISNMIDTAYDLHKTGQGNVSSFDIRAFLYGELYSPTSWDEQLVPQLLAWKAQFANETVTNPSKSPVHRSHLKRRESRRDTHMNLSAVDPDLQSRLTSIVIPCLDSIDQQEITTKDVFDELVRVTHEVSPIFGEISSEGLEFKCHRFPVRAVERFTGPFNHKLANPIILIGNKADIITPLANAQKIAAQLGDSAHVLEQDGFGHTSLAENSDCTQGIIRNYFLSGTLPTKGQICPTDQGLFPPNSTAIISVALA